jgi:tRNA A-37 threonylcarbamoyl transferase component Bud32
MPPSEGVCDVETYPARSWVWQVTMSSPAPTAERVLAGRYSLRRVVGRGGMGVLWAAQDETLGREVAVKEVRPSAGPAGVHDDVARERGLREARAAARVTHPSAVTVYDVVEEDGRLWIVMELLPPRTLADVLAEEGPMTPQAAARLGLDLVDALAAAHAAGVLHRDVKPANVLFADGRAVLVDFGIATVDDDGTLTAAGLLVGSPAFMAPERARGERPSPASDLWSLGATLFTAIEGESPFRRDGQLPTLAAVVTQDAPPAEHAGALRPLLAALLAREPADRSTAAQVRATLLTVLSADAIQPPGQDPTPEPALDTVDDLDDLDATVEAPVLPAVFLPRPRRMGAVAAVLLAPVTLFALAVALPLPWQHTAMRPPVALRAAAAPQAQPAKTSQPPKTTQPASRPAASPPVTGSTTRAGAEVTTSHPLLAGSRRPPSPQAHPKGSSGEHSDEHSDKHAGKDQDKDQGKDQDEDKERGKDG